MIDLLESLRESRPTTAQVDKVRFHFTFISVCVLNISSTRLDDEIYEHALRDFPELSESSHEKLVKINEDWMKSPEGKDRWRKFIET
jgi:hypothetical protein